MISFKACQTNHVMHMGATSKYGGTASVWYSPLGTLKDHTKAIM